MNKYAKWMLKHLEMLIISTIMYISCSEINGYFCHYRIYPVDDIFLFDETKHVADIYIMGFENFLIFA